MGLLAVKHLDPVVGIDVHSVLVAPSPTPVFLPHPHVGFMLDLREYVEAAKGVVGSIAMALVQEEVSTYLENHPDVEKELGDAATFASGKLADIQSNAIVAEGLKLEQQAAALQNSIGNMIGAGAGMGGAAGRPIFVNGLMRATVGTHSFHVPGLHFPLGESFAPPPAPDPVPSDDAEAFMGSRTVLANNDPMSFMALPALSCWSVGMEPPGHNSAHTERTYPSMPSSVMLPIPAGRPVMVGGPPVLNMAAAAKGLFRAFRGSKWARSLADKLNLKPGFLRCNVLGADPVNMITGEVVMQQLDFTIAGRLPIVWDRHYTSQDTRPGTVGAGWQTPADIRLELMQHATTLGAVVYFPDQAAAFETMPNGIGWSARVYDWQNGHALYRRGCLLILRMRIGVEYEFNLPAHWQHEEGTLSEDATIVLPVERMADLSGNAWIFERSSNGSLERMIEWRGEAASGRTIERGPVAAARTGCSNLLTSLTLIDIDGNAHRLVSYEHDRDGNLTAAIDAMNQPHQFEYAGGHRMIRHTNANGVAFRYSHRRHDDGTWRVDHAWGDKGLLDYRFVYDLAFRETRMTNSQGHTTILQANERGMPVARVDSLGGVLSYHYDAHGRTSAEIDLAGRRTTWEYDDCGNLLAKTLPDKSVMLIEYDADHQPVRVTASGNRQWSYAWDERGNLRRQTTPSQASMRYEYDLYGQLVTHIGSNGGVTRFDYDRDGNLEAVTDALGNKTLYMYDSRANVIQIINALGEVSRYEYDCNCNLTRAIEPNGQEVLCAYDANSNLIRHRNANGHVTRLEYSALGHVSKRLTPDGATAEYRYDTEGKLLGVVNERGELYQLKRDALGRIIEEIDYWGQSRRYEYSATGQLLRSADPLGQTIDYEADALGRLVNKHVSDPQQPDGIRIDKFSYDHCGNLIIAENPDIRIDLAYDAAGRVIQEKSGDDFVITSVYDAVGNRIERRTCLGADSERVEHIVRYAYDMLGAVSSIQIDDAPPMTFERDALGQIQVECLGPELRHELSYTSDGRLAKQALLGSTGALFASEYLYDANGELLEKRDSRLGVERYQYDPVGRLTEHVDPTGKLHCFLSDAAGDLLKTRIRPGSPIEMSGPEPQTDAWIREGRHGIFYYAFDRAGHMLLRQDPRQDLRLKWSGDGQLIETLAVRPASGTLSIRTRYKYDAFHRRVKKDIWIQHDHGAHTGSTTSCTTSSYTSCFYWDGDALVAEVATDETNTSKPLSRITIGACGDSLGGLAGVTTETGRMLREAREWIYYPGTLQPLAGIHFPVAVQENSQHLGQTLTAKQLSAGLHFFTTDPNGAPMRVTNCAGQVVWEMNQIDIEKIGGSENPGVFDQPLRFQGQYCDTETGLHYNRHRYFDPAIDCFTTPDPLGLAGGINLFAYAPNPLSWADPLGLTPHLLHSWIERGDRILLPHLWQIQSGGLTREQAGPWGLRSHTEPGYLELRDVRSEIQEGDVIRMIGTLDPCEPGCRPYLRDFAYENQVTIIYDATDTKMRWTFRPATFGEFGKRRRADVVVEVEDLVAKKTTKRRHWISNSLNWTSANCG
ncbi:UNVERIFIED_ORG: RHS repeat-associated protein [Burkholderia contaminans]|nr:RHS repeat-associated protein [Burkholderia contaminans]